MKNILLLKPTNFVQGSVNLNGSKSITNRALILASQAIGVTKLINISVSEDIHYLLIALNKLGVNYELSMDNRTCTIYGLGKPLYTKKKLKLFLGNSGTAIRLLLASLCLRKNDIILTGEDRLKERPIGPLVRALSKGGARIYYLKNKNFPPIWIQGGFIGGNISIDCSMSSQFLTALLLIAPLSKKVNCIYVKDYITSKPYIDITISVMKSFGVRVFHDKYKKFYFSNKNKYLSPGNFIVEGDASNASYFLAASAIQGGTVRVNGITRKSIQGDIFFVKILERMGAIIRYGNNFIECTKNKLYPIDIDANCIPDVVMTIAVIAMFVKNKLNKTSILKNIHNLRIKESDRISVMTKELRKVGAFIFEGKDYLAITPPLKFLSSRTIHTYDDHRIAMCFSLLSLAGISIKIDNPFCVKKSDPDFFIKLKSIGFKFTNLNEFLSKK